MNKKIIERLDSPHIRTHDTIRVFLRDIRVDMAVGIYQHEMKNAQPVVVSVELEAALPHHYQDRSEKKLDRVIDYEPIYNFIQSELPKMGHIYLLETLAEQIIDFCFREIRVKRVQVRLEKTAVFPHAAAAGIEVTRTRDNIAL
jgi:dihydroneopterin aldolase